MVLTHGICSKTRSSNGFSDKYLKNTPSICIVWDIYMFSRAISNNIVASTQDTFFRPRLLASDENKTSPFRNYIVDVTKSPIFTTHICKSTQYHTQSCISPYITYIHIYRIFSIFISYNISFIRVYHLYLTQIYPISYKKY